MYVPRRSYSTLLLQRKKGLSRWWMVQLELYDIGIVKLIERDETVCALEAVWYIPEAQYNLISIGMLNEKGCQIQVQ